MKTFSNFKIKFPVFPDRLPSSCPFLLSESHGISTRRGVLASWTASSLHNCPQSHLPPLGFSTGHRFFPYFPSWSSGSIALKLVAYSCDRSPHHVGACFSHLLFNNLRIVLQTSLIATPNISRFGTHNFSMHIFIHKLCLCTMIQISCMIL